MPKQTLDYSELVNIIDELYQNNSGYFTYSEEDLKKSQQEGTALTYGEILPNSLVKVIEKLHLKESDIFYDLGSGVGKVALQIFLTTPIKKSYGIEIFNPRHMIAMQVYSLIQEKYKQLFNNHTELASIEGNFLNHDLQNATVIFTDSLCFDNKTITALSRKFNQLPQLKHVITLKQMQLDHCKLTKKLNLQFSWSKDASTTVYVYTNKIHT